MVGGEYHHILLLARQQKMDDGTVVSFCHILDLDNTDAVVPA